MWERKLKELYVWEWEGNNNKSPAKKKKKKWAGSGMLWENWEAWDLDWCGKSKSDVASLGEDKKKKISHLHLLVYIIDYYDYPLSPFDLGIKILIGLGGLCKTFNSINPHVIP